MDNEFNENIEITETIEKNDRHGIKTGTVAVAVILAVFMGYMAGVITERKQSNNGVLQSRKIEKINELIEDNYYFSDKINYDSARENAYGSYVASFSDPFTYYISPDEMISFNESMTGNYVGIGVEVTVSEDNYITVTSAFDNGPAFKSGIEAGDRIIAVEGKEYSGDMLNEAVAVLKGHQGESVNVKIFDVSENQEKELQVVRSAVVAQTVKSEMLEKNIGYIKISSFSETTLKEFTEHFNNLQSASGLILDLRNNPGGILEAVVGVTDILIPEGKIVTIKYKNQSDEIFESDKECYDKKIVVLVNGNTASAAELLTGALRDVNNSVIVGKKTFGKGVVGTVYPIDSSSAAVITTGEYFLPGGDNIHTKGIAPNVEVDLPDTVKNIYLMKKSEDTQLQRALAEFE